MRRGLSVLLTVAVLAAASTACAPDQHRTGEPATRTISPVAPSTVPSSTGQPPTMTAPAPSPPPSSPPGTPAAAGTGITGQTVTYACPVDRDDPPCPATPVQARLAVLNPTAQAAVATVDTDPQGHFTLAVPAGTYLLRPVLIGGGPARHANNLPVTVAAGHYTTLTIRLDNDLR